MIKIRQATRSDFARIIELLDHYFDESAYGLHVSESPDPQHASRILFQVIHQGVIWLAEDDEKLAGILAVVREPNVWFPAKISLREMMWYVHPDYRMGTTSGRLLREYTTWAENELNSGRIEAYFMTTMATTTNIDLKKRGFRLAENLYIKD